MKIDRNKLNSILRSGLNPDVKTRKQLAQHLGMDPTSITRWFASRDRLGNPRYPVVPDRHVTKILQLFGLEPQCLALDDEEFRQHCFEISLQQAKDTHDLAQKSLQRLEQAAQRRLTVEPRPVKKTNKLPYIFVAVAILLASGWLVRNFNLKQNTQAQVITTNELLIETKCWTGYSPSLGTFDNEDKTDPCHYRQLFHNALALLKDRNSNNKSTTEFDASQAYIEFLSEQLDLRRTADKITLHIELGKNEIQQSNYPVAQAHFNIASKMLAASPSLNQKIADQIASYIEIANEQLNSP